jgi:hypothetical protein
MLDLNRLLITSYYFMKTLFILLTLIFSDRLLAQEELGRMITTTDSIYAYGTSGPKHIKLDSVMVSIYEGNIHKLRVYCSENGQIIVFGNGHVPITLRNFSDRKTDALHGENNNSFYVILGELFDFYYTFTEPFTPFPDDQTLILRISNNPYSIYTSSRVTSEFKLFSDLLGVVGANSNGLVQLNGKIKAILLSRNIIPDQPIYLLQNTEMGFNLSKFDNDYKHTEIFLDSTVNRMSMLQRSFFNCYGQVSLLKYIGLEGFDISLNTGFQFGLTNLYNSIDSIKTQVSLRTFYVQMPIMLFQAKKVNCSITNTLSTQKPFRSSSTDYLKNFNANTLYQFDANLFFDLSSKDRTNVFFIRFSQFCNLTAKGGDFQQLQIGYRKTFEDLFSKD